MSTPDSSSRRRQLAELFASGLLSKEDLEAALMKLSLDSGVAGSKAPPDSASDAYGNLNTADARSETQAFLVEPKVGDLLGGQFRLLEQVGRGGMGVVWKAEDSVGGRVVCAKLLPPEIQHSPGHIAKFQEAFRKVHVLQHEHLCPLYGLHRDERFHYFLTMKFIDGVTLDAYRHLYFTEHGNFPLAETHRLLTPVARCLDYIHAQRVVHRDLKPSNILVSRDGKVVQVIDLGLAAEVRTSMAKLSRRTNDLAGTAPYMAPEQWRGQQLDGRADQFALATIAYELLVGRLPFDCLNDTAWMHCALNEQLPEAQGLEKSWHAVLSRGRNPQTSDRFSDCLELIERLVAKPSETPPVAILTRAIPVVSLVEVNNAVPDTSHSQPTSWIVPSDKSPTIMSAIKQARSGDTIHVQPGDYKETVKLKSGITIAGTDRDLCKIHILPGRKHAISVEGVHAGRITQLTFSGSKGTKTVDEDGNEWLPDGIFVRNSEVKIENCVFRSFDGSGVLVVGQSEVVASNNLFEKCEDCGIRLESTAASVVRQNVCRSCGVGIGIIGPTTSVQVTANVCDENTHGIQLSNGAKGHVNKNKCRRNESCGILASGKGTQPELLDNVCEDNGKFSVHFQEGAGGMLGRIGRWLF